MSYVDTPSRLSYSAIREYAERVGNHYGIYDLSGRADLNRLLRDLGGRVEHSDSPESLHVNSKGSFVIYLPHMTSARRDRFTTAHEIGHYFLHYLHVNNDGYASFGRGKRNT